LINHNSARRVVYRGTTTWFTQDARYKEWKATGSLLWVHGKCASFLSPVSLLPLMIFQ
jgi:hypothetical protein